MVKIKNHYDILIVDDTTDSLELLSGMLAKGGYQVRAAPNSRFALESVAAKPPALILLDVKMPDMDGFEVCRRLKANLASRNIPVIFFSEYDETAKKVEGFKAGGVDFIAKPFEREEVLARIKNQLRLRELTERLESNVDRQTRQLKREIAERKKAQIALQQSEQRYRTLYESAGDAIFIHDLNGRFVAVNKAACERLGYSRQELLQMTFQDIETPEYAALAPERKKQIQREGFILCESAQVCRDRTTISIELHSRLTEYADKQAVLTMVRDITQRKKVEEAIRRSEEKYRLLFDNAPVGILSCDLQGRILEVNSSLLEMLGSPSANDTKKLNVRTFPLLVKAGISEEFRRCMEGGKQLNLEVPYVSKWGKRIYWRLILTPILDKDGAVTGCQAVSEDITARKLAEAKLQESEERYRGIFENAVEGIFQATPGAKGRFISANPAYARMLGYNSSEQMISEVTEIGPRFWMDPQKRKDFSDQVAKGAVTNFEVQLRRRDGRLIWVSLNARPVLDASGKLDYFEGIMLDITDRKRAEHKCLEYRKHLEELVNERTEELIAAKEQAEDANQAKTVFLANMSHELRSPLTIILGYAHLMQKESLLPTKQREYLNTISRNGEHLLTLINDVLTLSRIEANQTTLAASTFDLPALFVDLEKTFASSINAKGLFFKLIGIDNLPRYVTTDENKLRQVLINILGNAVKFTEHGGITMRAAVNNGTVGAMRLDVELQDTGIGIAEDEQGKVFDYFEQTSEGKAQKNGTGLGLTISRDYVRMMGGDITVTSQLGKGSVFRFEIDIKKGDETDLKEWIPTKNLIGLQPGQKVPRVLVAEDRRDSRILLVKILKSVGFEVKEAVNGEETVAVFNQWRPDFIWMDIRMPVMDGLEATQRIKKTRAGRSTIVAALTAQALANEKEQILAAGCDDFVRKPFREQEIFEVMAKHLDLRYVYEDEPVKPDAGGESEAQVTLQQLKALPADLLNRLHNALVELNKERILELIKQIKTIDEHMAKSLDVCVKRFTLSPLLDLLENIQRSENEESND